MSVGNILPYETVIIQVTHAVELTEDKENDSLRFHLPMHIRARYGGAPATLSAGAGSNTFFKLAAPIEMAHPISKIGCPSHTIEIELGPPSLNIPDTIHANYARVSFTSAETLSKDFILALKSATADAPRCIAERHPKNNTLTLALTVVPKFTLPDVPKQEFIFVVDRSGSMQGDRIETAKNALVVMLRSLPTNGIFFNIESFGSDSSLLWNEGSRIYDQTSLDEATKHVDTMTANHGGTEIRSALVTAFGSRKKVIPTSLFLLTDGDTYELDKTLATVKKEVLSASSEAPVRVFTLGIGNSASTAMVEGIARLGNGISTFVSDRESFAGKTARLLKSARTPVLSNIRINWGIPNPASSSTQDDDDDDFEMVPASHESKSVKLSLFDPSVDPLEKGESTGPQPVVLLPLAAIQQGPSVIRHLPSGSRIRVYAILSSQTHTFPSKVVLRASMASGVLDIPVIASQIPDDAFLAHVLAAKKLIQDLEDTEGGVTDLIRASIVRLGKTYSLASICTSFVAVDEANADAARRVEVAPPPELVSMERNKGIAVPRARPVGRSAASNEPSFQMIAPSQAHMSSSTVNPTFTDTGLLSTISRLRYNVSSFASAPAPTTSFKRRRMQGGVGSILDGEDGGDIDSSPTLFKITLESLARFQLFDGSFPSSPESSELFSTCFEDGAKTISIRALLDVLPEERRDETLTVTLFAMACMKHRLDQEKEAWEGMWDKAAKWCEGKSGVKSGIDVEELVEVVWCLVGK